ncbi:tryptophan halogenase family protein [Sphingomonas sp. BK235]|uniref:tryptophan halogenase family protein n=1 Tax=Sphingomonas sp. BK235 TaxID=2512131 RepID=UPI00104B8BE0|nr:tryptophan halogenase family protein [Sphingomonas sp. BK235]TCP33111.1 tryptophan halogenase [Sphingomonas sp. BK235]
MSTPAPVRAVTIVGGGTAGWMTAAALSRLVAAGVSVTLVESAEIGTVGVGEATIPSILDFLAMLGIDEHAFVRATGATFKLGIEFSDWGARGERYMHPFGAAGRDIAGVAFHQLWQRAARAGVADAGTLDDYSLCTVAARQHRFDRASSDPAAVRSTLRHALHFDATLVARFLRAYAEAAGVRRVEGRVDSVALAPETGHIAALRLADGRQLGGELFVDCSGFRALLIGETLGVGFESWRHWLPNDRALAVPSAAASDPAPYTRAMAERAGWRWRIPLQHRTGNGHVYASDVVAEEEAHRLLLAGLTEPALDTARSIRFEAGVRRRWWEGNCVAIGLAGGFLEPLESTSIHLIQLGITRLLALFPDTGFAAPERDTYNRSLRRDYEQARDFIILHYKATRRDDSDYWRHCRTMAVPDTLAERLALWRGAGRVLHDRGELFTPASWIAVLAGQEPPSRAVDPLAATLPLDETERFLRHVRDMVAKTAAAMPRHADYVARHCAAPARPAWGDGGGAQTGAG